MHPPERGTIRVFADIGCPWAHLCMYRLRRARAEAGLDDDLRFDIRAFPLELFNERATPKRTLDAEIPVAGALAPDAGWQMWTEEDHAYPVTTLPAMEAVAAAKEQSLRASEELDAALRVAFFGEARCISLHHEIMTVARSCPTLDASGLESALIAGAARRSIFADKKLAESGGVKGSPHVFLPDGSDAHNPGVAMTWEGGESAGYPRVISDDPSIYQRLITAAVS